MTIPLPFKLAQRFLSVTPIGAGTYAKVYKCQDTSLNNQWIALRVVQWMEGEEEIMQAELEACSFLQREDIACDYLVPVLDVVDSSENNYLAIVMPLYDYGDLEHFIEEHFMKKGQGMSYFLILQIMIQLSIALNVIHQHGQSHCDISLKNIFVKSFDEKLQFIEVVLGDFGVALSSENTLTLSQRRGTLEYLPPDAFKDRKYSPKTDFWSLGVLLFKLLFPSSTNSVSIYNLVVECGNYRERPYHHLWTSSTMFQQHGMTSLTSTQQQWAMTLRKIVMEASVKEGITFPALDPATMFQNSFSHRMTHHSKSAQNIPMNDTKDNHLLQIHIVFCHILDGLLIYKRDERMNTINVMEFLSMAASFLCYHHQEQQLPFLGWKESPMKKFFLAIQTLQHLSHYEDLCMSDMHVLSSTAANDEKSLSLLSFQTFLNKFVHTNFIERRFQYMILLIYIATLYKKDCKIWEFISFNNVSMDLSHIHKYLTLAEKVMKSMKSTNEGDTCSGHLLEQFIAGYYLRMGQYEEALKHLEKSLAAVQNVNSLMMKYTCKMILGDNQNTVIDGFTDLIKKFGPQPMFLIQRAIAYCSLQTREDVQKGIQDLRMAQQMFPFSLAIHYHLASIYSTFGDYDQVRQVCTEMIELFDSYDPENDSVKFVACVLWKECGELERALECAEALASTYQCSAVFILVAQISKYLHRKEQCLQWIEMALQVEPNCALAHMFKIQVLELFEASLTERLQASNVWIQIQQAKRETYPLFPSSLLPLFPNGSPLSIHPMALFNDKPFPPPPSSSHMSHPTTTTTASENPWSSFFCSHRKVGPFERTPSCHPYAFTMNKDPSSFNYNPSRRSPSPFSTYKGRPNSMVVHPNMTHVPQPQLQPWIQSQTWMQPHWNYSRNHSSLSPYAPLQQGSLNNHGLYLQHHGNDESGSTRSPITSITSSTYSLNNQLLPSLPPQMTHSNHMNPSSMFHHDATSTTTTSNEKIIHPPPPMNESPNTLSNILPQQKSFSLLRTTPTDETSKCASISPSSSSSLLFMNSNSSSLTRRIVVKKFESAKMKYFVDLEESDTTLEHVLLKVNQLLQHKSLELNVVHVERVSLMEESDQIIITSHTQLYEKSVYVALTRDQLIGLEQ
ncbi:hypothetical protein FDP41_002607 [Naegleria fowleri]|uniref:Protein kinase domain-containing protein n=1 Tax=Naegleria fowleri TaxID=5763 RepID=A0A6A5BTN1_NAEFO|nr:uncharacterized protein FDP41_002607 [Naegleria fowleri]KAF0978092.1 hypothetical protein FDP41_002607 [Naegleria fowleri]